MGIVRVRPKLIAGELLTLDFESKVSVILLRINYYSHFVLSNDSHTLNTSSWANLMSFIELIDGDTDEWWLMFTLWSISSREYIKCIPIQFAPMLECTTHNVNIIWLPLVLIDLWAIHTTLNLDATCNGYMLGTTVRLWHFDVNYSFQDWNGSNWQIFMEMTHVLISPAWHLHRRHLDLQSMTRKKIGLTACLQVERTKSHEGETKSRKRQTTDSGLWVNDLSDISIY